MYNWLLKFPVNLYPPQEDLEKSPVAPHVALQQLFVASTCLQKSNWTLLQEGLGKSVKIVNLLLWSNINIYI